MLKRKCTKPTLAKRRRKSSEKEIPKDIKDWNVDTLDHLQIHYDMHAMKTPCDVLDTINCVPCVQNKMQDVLRFVKKNVKFSVAQSKLKNITLADLRTVVDERQELKECIHKLDTDQWVNVEKEILMNILSSAVDLMDRILLMMQMITRRDKVNEAVYTDIFNKFASMCYILPSSGSQITRCHKMCEVDVTSTPDARFLQLLPTDLITNVNCVVSVLEDKKKVVDSCSDFGQITRASAIEDSAELQQGRFSAVQLDTGLLGQHGGELLLELPFSTLTPNMLGIIVKGTKVMLTILRMSRTHLHKLEENEDLTYEDKASISYSEFYDILDHNERNEVLEAMLRIGLLQHFMWKSKYSSPPLMSPPLLQ